MKKIALFFVFYLISSIVLCAQSRLSLAPAYWFNYGRYTYQLHSYNGTDTKIAGYNLSSSIGLVASYHFTPKWNLSLGLLYNTNSTRLTSQQSNNTPFTSNALQLPVLFNYRLNGNRLSPYFSFGAFLTKSQIFTEDKIKTSAIVGVGIDYKLCSNLSLLVQPIISYQFTNPADNPIYQYRNYVSYNLGLQTQLVWRFN